MELINENEDEDTDENQVMENMPSNAPKGIPKSFSCLKHLLPSFESADEDTKLCLSPSRNLQKAYQQSKASKPREQIIYTSDEEKYKVIIERY